MKRIKKESDGTGVEPVKQPAPGRRIYPPKCATCGGKGRIKEGD